MGNRVLLICTGNRLLVQCMGNRVLLEYRVIAYCCDAQKRKYAERNVGILGSSMSIRRHLISN